MWEDLTCSHWRCFIRKGVLRIFAKFTEKHLRQSLFFDKVAGLRPQARVSFLIKLQASGLRSVTLLKKGLWHKRFPVNFVKCLRTPFYWTPLEDCFWSWQNRIFKVFWKINISQSSEKCKENISVCKTFPKFWNSYNWRSHLDTVLVMLNLIWCFCYQPNSCAENFQKRDKMSIRDGVLI